MFSTRVPDELGPNALTAALEQARRAGAPLIDLTVSNPTRMGFPYPPDLLAPLADARGLRYEPDACGPREGREAVADDYRRRGIVVDPARVVLTASTSEAYAWLFKLLCEPGDEVLVPQPSYPLFEHLARLDLVVPRPYALDPHGGWSYDAAAMAAAVTERTRAIIVVSPNNPTGTCLDAVGWTAVDAVASAHRLAVISDEVFTDYPLSHASDTLVSVLSRPRAALGFALGGLSKSIGLPQAKVAWMAATGPAQLVDAALRRLEVIADAYLSVSTPAARALCEWFERGAVVRESIAVRVARNYAAAQRVAARSPWCGVQPAGGGWSVVLRVPAVRTEEAWCLALLNERGVLVHPGYFFDFPSEAYLVASLLARPEAFDEGVARICGFVEPR